MRGSGYRFMNEKTLGVEILFVVMLAFSFALAMVCSYGAKSCGRHEVQTEAVEAGVGKWNVANDGTTVFEWVKQ
jgi:hypothetical protein